MGKAFLYGNGGGGYTGPKVIGSPTQPSNPKDNTVWVQTSTPISSWEMSSVAAPGWDTAPAGFVYFTMDTSDWTVPNLVKFTKGSVGNVFLKATRCWQNLGVPGATQWKSMNAYVYHNNTWVQFSSPRNTPEFTYTGDYAIVDDNDNAISDFATWTGNWKIRFLTSGTLTFTNLNGAEGGIDVFLVGGGGGGGSSGTYGGGGGGGYTKTIKAVAVHANTTYTIVVGAGGGKESPGGESSIFGASASGGKPGAGYGSNDGKGGDGGSGGGAYGSNGARYGGTDGSDGEGPDNSRGKGQGSTTREFGESSGRLYSGGGSSGQLTTVGASKPPIDETAGAPKTSPPANRGGGGGGTDHVNASTGTAGGSGIVIIRNKR